MTIEDYKIELETMKNNFNNSVFEKQKIEDENIRLRIANNKLEQQNERYLKIIEKMAGAKGE